MAKVATGQKNDGGPAWPRAGAETNAGWSWPTDGMSLRDYFAGQALAGMDECADAERMAHWAYKIADAMLAEREK